jgi:hypothetical protein
MANPKLVKAYNAEGAIGDHLIVIPGAADGGVAQATAVTEALLGVTDAPKGVADTERVTVVHDGIADVVYGGTVAAGDFLTTDASGRAIASAPGAGTNHNVIGRAVVAGVVGDLGKVHLSIGRIQG